MTRPRLLDLCSGAGGAGACYHRAGFDIVGVDVVPQPVTITAATVRPRILAALAESPGQGAHELAGALGCDNRKVADLLRWMHNAGMVVAHELTAQPRAGHPARIYFVASEGTPPRPRNETRAEAEERRRRTRIAQQRRRARLAGKPALSLPLPAWQADAGPGCQNADPGLFFGPEIEGPQARAERVAAAQAVCSTCPVRRSCLDGALTRGERWGVWAGVDLETERRTALPQSGPAKFVNT